jgi:hypothetical protein
VFDQVSERLASKHASNGLLIDTNLLLLLIVGRYDKHRISSFKRTDVYSVRDYGLLREFVSKFRTLWTTPQILTETDNLGRQLSTREHKAFAEHVRKHIWEGKEAIAGSVDITAHGTFARLGYCDAAIMLKSKDCLLISDDLPLYLAAINAGYDAINFNHLRL